MKLNVFGTEMEVVRRDGQWLAFYLGNEGKKRLADDLSIPAELDESELMTYLADVYHEWSTPGRDKVLLLSEQDRQTDS